MNCRNIDVLTEHGRCATCDSDSVAIADVGRSVVRNDVEELERMFRAPARIQLQEEPSLTKERPLPSCRAVLARSDRHRSSRRP